MSRYIGFQGNSAQQYGDELITFLTEIVGKEKVGRYLQIGMYQGTDFHAVTMRMEQGSLSVGVDLPVDDPGAPAVIAQVITDLTQHNYNAIYIPGDSHSADVIEAVRKHGSFDLCFIDGDHTYEGTKQDWENYGSLSRIVAFHDINSHMWELGCGRLWGELKTQFRSREIVGQWPEMGVGVLWRE